MRVLIVNNMAPFTWGGAEELAVNLERALLVAGHDAEVVRIPFSWEPPTRIPSQMLMVRSFELENTDRVIAFKFPAYLIRHPSKILWLLHQFRQAYDLYDAGVSNLRDDSTGAAIRALIKGADDETFAECRRIFVNSEVTRDRLAKFNRVQSETLRPPLNDADLFTGGAPEGYIFAGGRVNSMKRQSLLVEALALAPGNVRLVIAGPPGTPEDGELLRRLAEERGVADRVQLDLRFLARREIADYVNRSTAIASLPYDEDSLSYVAMEGAAAGKAVLTTTDSGGVVRLVRHGETGWLAQPTPSSLAEGLTYLAANESVSVEMGRSARQLFAQLVPTWPQAVEQLLS